MKNSLVAALFLTIACTTAQPGSNVTPEADQALPYTPQIEEIALETATGDLHGTLLVPSSDEPIPVALLIAGSGPTDRNGNNPGLPGPNNSLRQLAEALAQDGIATVRYDKRGIGASAAAAPSEADLRFDHYVEDAVAWIQFLAADPRFSTVTVIGHSEGSLIGMIAAERGNAHGYVSIAGIGTDAPTVIRRQLRPQLPPQLWEESERVLEELVAGRTVANPPAALAALYRPSVQPYMISWFRFDPVTEIARLDIPVLIVQGTTDIQVSEDDAKRLADAARNGELLMVNGMNHVLKSVPADQAAQIASYGDPSLRLAEGLAAAIRNYIRALR